MTPDPQIVDDAAWNALSPDVRAVKLRGLHAKRQLGEPLAWPERRRLILERAYELRVEIGGMVKAGKTRAAFDRLVAEISALELTYSNRISELAEKVATLEAAATERQAAPAPKPRIRIAARSQPSEAA